MLYKSGVIAVFIAEFPVKDDAEVYSLKADSGKTPLLANKTEVVFIKYKDGRMLSFFAKVVEDLSIKDSRSVINQLHYNNIPGSFSGAIFYYSLSGQFINGESFMLGVRTGDVSFNESGTHSPAVNSLVMHNASGCVTTTIYKWTCWKQPNDSGGYDYVDCTEKPIGTITTCPSTGGGGVGGDQGGGSGGGTPNPCGTVPPPSPITNVSSVSNGRVTVQNVPAPPPVGGGGSTGGGTPCPTNPTNGTPTSSPIFGINNSNAVILDSNFDNFLNYLDSKNIKYSNPYNVILTVNGVDYTGQNTDIYSPDGTVIHYFSPDENRGPFQQGMEYAIGIGTNNSNVVNTTTNINVGGIYVQNAASYLGSGSVVFKPLTIGGGGVSLTLEQRAALESADNNRVLQMSQQEDASDDVVASPCHGTARNGNVK